jgi:hypothetical protein
LLLSIISERMQNFPDLSFSEREGRMLKKTSEGSYRMSAMEAL